MRKSRFTESQIAAILKEGSAGVPVAEILRKHGISLPTYFNWKSKHGGASVQELVRLKELEAENAKLKRMYAELALENTAIKDPESCDALREAAGDRDPARDARPLDSALVPDGAIVADGLLPAARRRGSVVPRPAGDRRAVSLGD